MLEVNFAPCFSTARLWVGVSCSAPLIANHVRGRVPCCRNLLEVPFARAGFANDKRVRAQLRQGGNDGDWFSLASAFLAAVAALRKVRSNADLAKGIVRKVAELMPWLTELGSEFCFGPDAAPDGIVSHYLIWVAVARDVREFARNVHAVEPWGSLGLGLGSLWRSR